MRIVLLVITALAVLNGDFSQGLAHWSAGPGWRAANGAAVLQSDNRGGAQTRVSDLCSAPVAVRDAQRVSGAADILIASRNGNGYVFAGVVWSDATGKRLGSEMLADAAGKEKRMVHVTFATTAPDGAQAVQFCFFGGTYPGKTFRARVDNAVLR